MLFYFCISCFLEVNFIVAIVSKELYFVHFVNSFVANSWVRFQMLVFLGLIYFLGLLYQGDIYLWICSFCLSLSMSRKPFKEA